jgi:hypothetical protein
MNKTCPALRARAPRGTEYGARSTIKWQVKTRKILKNNHMKNQFTLILLIAIALVFAGCNSKKKNVPKRHIPTEKELAAFDEKINSLAKELNIKQLSYTIVNEKEILESKGIGADEKTVYHIGSLSNIFTSAILLQLTEEQKIDIKKYVAEYSTDNTNKNATLKQLLSYTSSGKPGTNFSFDTSNYGVLKNIIQTVSEKSYSRLLKNITRKCGMKNTETDANNNCLSSAYDLAKFSLALDNHKLFNDENTYELMYRPVYLSNGEITPSALGWFIQFYNDKKYAWSYGQGKDFSSIVIKSLTDSLTLVVLANSESLNAPFALNNCDLFTSPVACEFVKIFSMYNNPLPRLDFNSPVDTIEKELAFSSKLPSRDLMVKEYLSYINMYNYVGNKSKSQQLTTIFNKALPYEMPYELITKPPRAIIKNVGDYLNLSRNFELLNDTTINVYSVGEFVKEVKNNIYENDLVEIYLDYQNNKKKAFDAEQHRQYRFNYDYPEITGTYSTAANIKFVQAEPSKTSYFFEISIPWKSLGNTKAEVGKKIGLDLSAADNDGTESRKNNISWHFEKSQQAWSDPSVFGTMILSDKSEIPNDSVCYSLKTSTPINIDGKIEAAWNSTNKYKLNRTTYGNMPNSKDFAVSYRTLWDNDNLYFLVEFIDDKKNKLPNGGDWGWIENDKQDTIWMMKEKDAKYAGGSLSNKYINTSIHLKKGNYVLKYKTNQTNSFGRWTNQRPENGFYGIAVY